MCFPGRWKFSQQLSFPSEVLESPFTLSAHDVITISSFSSGHLETSHYLVPKRPLCFEVCVTAASDLSAQISVLVSSGCQDWVTSTTNKQILMMMEAEKARIQVLVDLVPGEGCLAGVCLLSVPHVVLEMWCGGRGGDRAYLVSYKCTNLILGPLSS